MLQSCDRISVQYQRPYWVWTMCTCESISLPLLYQCTCCIAVGTNSASYCESRKVLLNYMGCTVTWYCTSFHQAISFHFKDSWIPLSLSKRDVWLQRRSAGYSFNIKQAINCLIQYGMLHVSHQFIAVYIIVQFGSRFNLCMIFITCTVVWFWWTLNLMIELFLMFSEDLCRFYLYYKWLSTLQTGQTLGKQLFDI